jgi:cell division protein FtsQ
MHQRKGKKILIYFFLLILVGSINNIDLSSLKFEKVKDINVDGLEETENSILLKKIHNLNLDNIFFVNREDIQNQLDSNSLVEKYNIFKIYPDSLNIKIEKTKFLARTNNNGKIYFVGSNGKLSKNNLSNVQLPFIFGKPKIKEFLYFKKIIDESKFSYNEIKNFYFFSSKRWDLELKNNIIIKLSSNYPKDSLQLAFEFLHNSDLTDIKIIDARVKNQIILNG